MCAYMVHSNLPQDETNKVQTLLENFKRAFGEIVETRKLRSLRRKAKP